MTAARSRLALLALCIVLVGASAAHAQALGGGGGAGLLQPIIQWAMDNIVRGLISVGIIALGVVLVCMRFYLAAIAYVVIGALIITHYDTIQGLFG